MKDIQKNNTPEELTKEEQRIVAQVTKIQSFQSPIPPPEIIKGYEQTLPGSAERILTMVEQQANHRIATEKEVVKHSIKQKWIGLIVGSIALFVILAMGFYFAIKGLVVLASIILTTTLLGVLAIMILGKNPNNKS